MAKIFIALIGVLISVLLIKIIVATPIAPSEHIMKIKRTPNKQKCDSLFNDYREKSLNKVCFIKNFRKANFFI